MTVITNAKGLVDINGLNETAVKMRPELMMLPAVYLGDEFARMGVSLIPGVQNKVMSYNFIRKGGLMRPYYPGMQTSSDAIARVEENELQVYLAAGILDDNIQNYTQFALGEINLLGTNKTYANPMNALILYSIMKTWGEDLLDASMFAKRKADGKNKYDVFDGFYTHIQKAKTDGKIVEGRNMFSTGPIIEPIDDTDSEAYKQVSSFLRRVNPALLRGGALLLVTAEFDTWLQEAIANKFKYVVTPDQYGTYAIPGYKQIRVVPCQNFGKGDLMILTKPGNLMLGFDSMSDDEYVRARNIKDDANIVTYNIQARYGCGIRSYDPKVFSINDGSLQPVTYAGDEVGPDTSTVTVTAGSNGTVAVNPQKNKYAVGELVSATATPSEGYVFDSWSDGVKNNPYQFTVIGDKTLSATFKAKS